MCRTWETFWALVAVRVEPTVSLFSLGKQLYFLVTPSAPWTFDILTFLIVCVYFSESRCPREARRRHRIPGVGVAGGYGLPNWVLGIKLSFSARASCAHNHRVISLAFHLDVLVGRMYAHFADWTMCGWQELLQSLQLVSS